MVTSFEPIVDEQSKIIILGSIPGLESLRKEQYYGHNRNQFWEIIYSIFSQPKDIIYADRVDFLRRKHIALWDVVKKCQREGSLDSNIKNEEVNDLIKFLNKYSNIKHVVFNGTTSYRLFKKHVGFSMSNIENFYQMPSTSPANTKPIMDKVKEWKKIQPLVKD